jgi:predicted nucleic acid-binding protein
LTLFVDISVWSLAFRRDTPGHEPEVREFARALKAGETVVTTGLVLQELLQGFVGPKDRKLILERISALPLISPDRQDHIEAADLKNKCRRAGIQIGTIDALFAQLCVRHDLTMLAADNDFRHVAKICGLEVWVE